jgi:hypothetical protein
MSDGIEDIGLRCRLGLHAQWSPCTAGQHGAGVYSEDDRATAARFGLRRDRLHRGQLRHTPSNPELVRHREQHRVGRLHRLVRRGLLG